MENVPNQQQPKAKMNKTWLLVAVLVIVTVILLVVSLTAKNTFYKPTASENVAKDVAQTSLMFSEDVRPSTSSGAYEVDVNIDTNNNMVTFAQLEMSYDPKLINIIDIKPGNFFADADVKQKIITPADSRIKFWSGMKPNQKGKQGKGTVAVITFTKTGSSPAQINFLPKTSIQASGTDKSVLKDMVSGYIENLPSEDTLSPSPTNQVISQ